MWNTMTDSSVVFKHIQENRDDWSDSLNVPLIYNLLMTCWAAASGDPSLLLSQSLRKDCKWPAGSKLPLVKNENVLASFD